MKRQLPAPEAVPDIRTLPNPKYAPGQLAQLAAVSTKAALVLARCYAPLGPTPHGFNDTAGFIDACRARDAYNRLYRCLCRRIAAKEVARGRLVLA